jgi:hypothetical protein
MRDGQDGGQASTILSIFLDYEPINTSFIHDIFHKIKVNFDRRKIHGREDAGTGKG